MEFSVGGCTLPGVLVSISTSISQFRFGIIDAFIVWHFISCLCFAPPTEIVIAPAYLRLPIGAAESHYHFASSHVTPLSTPLCGFLLLVYLKSISAQAGMRFVAHLFAAVFRFYSWPLDANDVFQRCTAGWESVGAVRCWRPTTPRLGDALQDSGVIRSLGIRYAFCMLYM
jgi:hypothetical protein